MSSGVMIQRMQIQGDTRQKNAFLQSLDSQNWMGEDAEEIVFINKIHVQGQWWELAQKIALESNTRVMQSSVDDITNQQIKVFSNQISLSAQIIIDLLNNEKSWYLSNWLKQTELKPEPIAILLHRPTDIPDILVLLEKKSYATRMFDKLQTDELVKLQQALIHLFPQMMSVDWSIDSPENSTVTSWTLSNLQRIWLQRYFSQGNLNVKTKLEKTTLLSCISLLSLWKYAPQGLSNNQFAQRWSSAVIFEFNKWSSDSVISNIKLDSPDRVEMAISKSSSATQSDNSLQTVNQPLFEINAATKEESGPDIPAHYIGQAGLLFLLNLLKNYNFASAAYSPNNIFSNPWLYIFQTFKRISEELKFSMDHQFESIFCEITHCEKEEFNSPPEQLNQEHFQSSLDYVQRRLESLQLWYPDWMQIKAKLVIEEAYIHLYLDQSAVRVDLRLAGLDVNPGWVPWLGRVINFHYGSYPELVNDMQTIPH